jgi:hypothetical protein
LLGSATDDDETAPDKPYEVIVKSPKPLILFALPLMLNSVRVRKCWTGSYTHHFQCYSSLESRSKPTGLINAKRIGFLPVKSHEPTLKERDSND